MYKRHKIVLLAVFVGTFIITYLYGLDFAPIAETAITVASIAMGVYIAAVSALLGSNYAKSLRQITDKEYPNKTLLGVLADYFRIAGAFCIFLIVIGYIYTLPAKVDISSTTISYILRSGAAISYSVFSVNILFLWLILQFLINSLGKATNE